MTECEDNRTRTLTKYRELNDQLRDFLKGLVLFEKSSSTVEPIDQAGISLLAVKNDLLLQYLTNLVAVMHQRATPNRSLTSPSARSMILRLCEIRTYLEKIRPIEHKLQYEIDKLLKSNEDKQLSYRANIDNFDQTNDNQTGKEENVKGKPQVYRPPKLVPMEFHDDVETKNGTEKIDKHLEHLKRRAYHSDILDEYRAKYSDAPEEIQNSERSRLLKQSRAYKEKIEYEENYLKRLPQTKRERIQLQRSMNQSGPDDLAEHLNDADILFGDTSTKHHAKKKSQLSRKTKKRLEKKKTKSSKRFKSRK